MANIRVSADMFRKYYNHPSVCGDWKDQLREDFDLYESSEFDVPVSFIKEAAAYADAELVAMLKADFPTAFQAGSVRLAQAVQLMPDSNIMTGIQIAGNSAKNSKLPDAVGRGIFLDGNFEYLIRKTKKGNYLIVPIEKNDAEAPKKFELLSNVIGG